MDKSMDIWNSKPCQRLTVYQYAGCSLQTGFLMFPALFFLELFLVTLADARFLEGKTLDKERRNNNMEQHMIMPTHDFTLAQKYAQTIYKTVLKIENNQVF